MKEIKLITKKLKTIEKKIEEKDRSIEALEKLIESSNTNKLVEVVETVDNKIETFENNLQTVKQCLEEKDSFINKLELRVAELETMVEDIVKTHGEKVKELENKMNNFETNAQKNILDDKVKDLAEKQSFLIEEAKENYKCNQCEFTTYYKKGLKIHKKKMHQSYSCELCEEIYDTKRDLKIHTYKHSYTRENRMEKCNSCNFTCNTIDTMEVHVGKCRKKEFECGLCETNFLKICDLEIHLKTCEIYQCGNCFVRDKNLSEMKKHVEKTHKYETEIGYLKMDRDSESEVSQTFYSLSEL